ncbi:MAG: CsgG/HfaB family protein [Pseudomonadota bacterium]
MKLYFDKHHGLTLVSISFLLILVSGCTLYPGYSTQPKPPILIEKTQSYFDLMALPKPKGPIPVAVFNFRDQTGQYKPQHNVSSFSTAVTQGATSILIEALAHSDWFIPLEREGLQNILTERKIIRAAKQSNNDQSELSPLMTSSILLEGGIIGYDTNTVTGGAGLGYYGISVGELYRQDNISIYLRAVDVRTSRILASVSTSKTVLSKEIRTGFFRYVSLNRLAEAEFGYSTNEPHFMSVKQAVHKAVFALIIEGIEKGIWQLKTSKDLEHPLIQAYKKSQQAVMGLSNNKTDG